jgi:hypothetical protein
MTDTELREQVRARYAEAASAVRGAAARGEPLQMVDPDQCCSGATGVRSPYYSADEHEALPDEAATTFERLGAKPWIERTAQARHPLPSPVDLG